MKKIFSAFVLLGFFSLGVGNVLAQEGFVVPPGSEDILRESESYPVSLATSTQSSISISAIEPCFDQNFPANPISATIASVEKASLSSGDVLRGNILLENTTSVPFVNSSVYLRIVKKSQGATDPETLVMNQEVGDQPQSDVVVDQFFVEKNIVLSSNSEKTLVFEWTLPQNLSDGQYEVVPYGSLENGEIYMDSVHAGNIQGNGYEFTVDGAQSDKIVILPTSVSLNGKLYDSRSLSSIIAENEPITSTIKIEGIGDGNNPVRVNWNLFALDAAGNPILIDTKVSEINLVGGTSETVEYQNTDTMHTQYMLVAEVINDGVKNIFNIYATRGQGESIKTSALRLSNFPLSSDTNSKVSICVRSQNEQHVAGKEVKIGIFDENNNLVNEKVYSQVFVPAWTSLAVDLGEVKKGDKLTLVASVLANGQVLAENRILYDCSAFGDGACGRSLPIGYIALVIGLSMVLLLTAFALHINNKNKKLFNVDNVDPRINVKTNEKNKF